ncbi:MAG: hypothetical protein Q9211_001347 [Gyalolechia sp. 1 TL-2023]
MIFAKAVALCDIRALAVVLGTFKTNMGNAATICAGKDPLNYDKDEARKAVYEVVVGKGAGGGREAENYLPLGSE